MTLIYSSEVSSYSAKQQIAKNLEKFPQNEVMWWVNVFAQYILKQKFHSPNVLKGYNLIH